MEILNTSYGVVSVNDFTTSSAYSGYSNPTSYSYKGENATISKKGEIMAIAKGKRGLFQVILVNPRNKEIILNSIVIADSIDDVLLEVDAGKIIKEKGLQVSDVDKIINILGEIRKTRKSKDTGELEIITEDK